MRRRLGLSIALFTLAVLVAHGAQMDPLEAEMMRWTAEVERHVPGHADEAARALAQWPWARLNPVLRRLFSRNRAVKPTLFLRAAVAYGDVSLAVPRDQRPVYPGLYTGNDRVTLAKDGHPVGVTQRDTHLRLAHELVRRVVQYPQATGEHNEVAVGWYVAHAAALASVHDLASLKDHLEEARDQFPQHAEIQFLSGCLAESIASPAIQAALRETDDTNPVARKPFQLLRERVLARGPNLELAEHHYGKALDAKPQHSEARIRLARVLTIDGGVKEALPLLEAPFESADTILAYYRYLFLGRAYQATGRTSVARQSFEAASRLFPDAQSPWLALSALAASLGDAEASRTALERIIQRTDAQDDPWWHYDECSGRDARRIYEAFAERVSRLGTGSSPGDASR